MESIREKVAVIARFSERGSKPVAMRWRGRVVRFLTHTFTSASWQGRAKIYYFSLTSAQGNVYKLSFNSDSLEWRLEEIDFKP